MESENKSDSNSGSVELLQKTAVLGTAQRTQKGTWIVMGECQGS